MRKFFLFYTLLSIAVITVKLLGLDQLENFLKPLLMPSLALFYISSSKKLKLFDYKIIAALLFSTLGDILLMPLFGMFIPGLLGFMVAHFFYISAFLQEEKKPIKESSKLNKILLLSGTIIYFLLLSLLLPAIDTIVTQIAITIYASVLFILLFSSIKINTAYKLSQTIIPLGAFLFLLSDGMIAINKFLLPIPAESLFIMGTYTAAQALIVIGIMKKNNFSDSK